MDFVVDIEDGESKRVAVVRRVCMSLKTAYTWPLESRSSHGELVERLRAGQTKSIANVEKDVWSLADDMTVVKEVRGSQSVRLSVYSRGRVLLVPGEKVMV